MDLDDQIQYIRDVYRDTNRDIDENGLYRTVVDVNADEMSYPAVGIYHPVLTLFFGFSEENPYPDNLRIAHLTVDRSAYHEYYEFLYDGFGRLIFVYASGVPDLPESRFYYSQGQLLMVIQDSVSITDFSPDEMELGNRYFNQGESLLDIFRGLSF
jgi:hypothetical protein